MVLNDGSSRIISSAAIALSNSYTLFKGQGSGC